MEDSTRVNQFVISEDLEFGHDSEDVDDQEPKSLDTVSGLSSCSSPIPQEPFREQFTAKVLPQAITSDGDQAVYKVQSKRMADCQEVVVKRVYDDFVYLHHCLTTSVLPGDGLIIPPVPPKAAITAQQAAQLSKSKLGATCSGLLNVNWYKDCFHLTEYLKHMLRHPIFGRNSAVWEKFLTSAEPDIKVNVKKSSSLMSRISDNFESRNKLDHKDCDEYFQKERDWVSNYLDLTKLTCDAFEARIFTRLSEFR